ncbi:hypothetical protein V492_01416 [Pseudogymnoascus sp. VKM F-4246]|nr:hypothetical protein V492_01416 [Pseudogymnoascus sp. VKM F-4246]
MTGIHRSESNYYATWQSAFALVLLLLLQCISVSAVFNYSSPKYPTVPFYGPQDGDTTTNCPTLPDDITDYTPPTNCAGPALAVRGVKDSNITIFERQDGGGACVLGPDGGGPVTIGVTTGPTVGPTCASSCGGVLCSGYLCSPQPTGYPPGFQDPRDPNSQDATATPTTIGPTITTTTTTPPTSPPPDTDPPIPTIIPGGTHPEYYCFREHLDQGNYQKFGEDVGDPAIQQICYTTDVLSPSNTFGFAVRASGNLLLSVSWAKDQTGCPPKQDVPLTDWCRDSFREIIIWCDDSIESDTYGGAYIESNSDYGCVMWWIGTSELDTSSANNFAANGASNGVLVTDVQQQQSIKAMLDAVEPHLPRIVREGK